MSMFTRYRENTQCVHYKEETKLQIGIRLHDIEPGTLEQRVMRAHEQGFTCGHLALAKTVTEHSVANSALTPGYAAYLRKMFAKYDVDIAVLGCYLNLAHPDPEELRKIQERYFAHIRFASILGCSVVGTETGAPNADYHFEPACHTEEALQKSLALFLLSNRFGVTLSTIRNRRFGF